jgi:hypothetical protein
VNTPYVIARQQVVFLRQLENLFKSSSLAALLLAQKDTLMAAYYCTNTVFVIH